LYKKDIPWLDIDACILFFGADDMQTFEQMKVFHKSFDVLQQQEKKKSTLLKPCICVGNKSDIPDIVREVPITTAMKFSDESKVPYFEVSSKSGKNVSIVIEDLLKQIIRYKKQVKVMNENIQIKSGGSGGGFFRSMRESDEGFPPKRK
jgi:hypothetical protein